MELQIENFENMSTLIPEIQFRGCFNITLKIINENTVYVINWKYRKLEINQFRKQIKELEIRTEYSQKMLQQYKIICRNKAGQYVMLSTQEINPIYCLQFSSSNQTMVQISIGEQILMSGFINQQQFHHSSILKHTLKSVDNNKIIVMQTKGRFIQSQINNQSHRTFYHLRYYLKRNSDQSKQYSNSYDLEIVKVDQLKKKQIKLKTKMNSNENINSDLPRILHQFEKKSGFLTEDMNLQLKIIVKHANFNSQLGILNNSIIIQKSLIINPSPQQVLSSQTVFLRIKQHQYRGQEFNFYDQHQKYKLYLQIHAKKLPLYDQEKAKYTIKIPQLLWKMNLAGKQKQNLEQQNYQLQTYLSNRKNKGDKILIRINSQKQYYFSHFNYNDGLSIQFKNQIGYSKIHEAMKCKCQIFKNQIGWIEQSSWYLLVINLNNGNFYCLIKCEFDPFFNGDSDEEKSHRTVSKDKSERSNSQRIDPLAKTVSNMQMFKLKKLRNNLIIEGRHFTTKYVQKQETVIALNKKIQQVDQLLKQKHRQENQVLEEQTHHKVSYNHGKMVKFYRSICECGARNPKFHGYCEQCLNKLRKRYEIYYKQYKQIGYNYEKKMFDKYNSKQKIIQLKNCIQNYKNRLRTGQNTDNNNIGQIIKELEQKNWKQKIQQLKVKLFQLEEQTKSISEMNNYRQSKLEEKIKISDNSIWKLTQQLSNLRLQKQDLERKIQKENKQSE